jgi:hypothetical protein
MKNWEEFYSNFLNNKIIPDLNLQRDDAIKTLGNIKLTEEQQRVEDLLIDWLQNGNTPMFILFGLPGCGKTTILLDLLLKVKGLYYQGVTTPCLDMINTADLFLDLRDEPIDALNRFAILYDDIEFTYNLENLEDKFTIRSMGVETLGVKLPRIIFTATFKNAIKELLRGYEYNEYSFTYSLNKATDKKSVVTKLLLKEMDYRNDLIDYNYNYYIYDGKIYDENRPKKIYYDFLNNEKLEGDSLKFANMVGLELKGGYLI